MRKQIKKTSQMFTFISYIYTRLTIHFFFFLLKKTKLNSKSVIFILNTFILNNQTNWLTMQNMCLCICLYFILCRMNFISFLQPSIIRQKLIVKDTIIDKLCSHECEYVHVYRNNVWLTLGKSILLPIK